MIELAIEGEAAELFSSPLLLDELAHALGYAKFTARIRGFGTSIEAMVAQYTALMSLVTSATVPSVVANDADADHVIAAAVAAHVELIVTGGRKHLLPIASHRGIAIVTARLSIGSQHRPSPDADALALSTAPRLVLKQTMLFS